MKKLSPLPASRTRSSFLLLIFIGLLTPWVQSEEQGWEACIAKGHLTANDSLFSFAYESKPGVGGRHYERDRRIDVKHLKLDLTPNFARQSMASVATITFSPIAKPLDQLRLDAIKLTVQKVESSVPIADWENDDKQIILTFKKAIPVGEKAWVKITSSVEKPLRGLYFRTEAMGYPKGDDQLWTQGEPERHRYWFPGSA